MKAEFETQVTYDNVTFWVDFDIQGEIEAPIIILCKVYLGGNEITEFLNENTFLGIEEKLDSNLKGGGNYSKNIK